MIIGIATPAATAAYSAADGRIPTIFCAVNDPVSIKLVNSLEKSGNNCTGSSDRLNLDGQLKMIRAFQPDAKKIGVLYNTAEANSLSNLKTLEELAGQYGFEIVSKGVQNAGDIPIAAASLEMCIRDRAWSRRRWNCRPRGWPRSSISGATRRRPNAAAATAKRWSTGK